MIYAFKYVFYDDLKDVQVFNNAFEILSAERIVIDALYLPVVECAERGVFRARLEMQEAFASGAPGVPKHYKLARRYTDLIKKENAGKIELEVESLINSALLELDVQNYDLAKQELLQAASLTVQNLPIEKWDFRVFNLLESHQSDR